MKPPHFDYVAPRTVPEAVSLLQQHEGEAKALSGGQSLIPLLNMRLARPAVPVDLARIPGLDYVREADRGLVIGAMTRQRTVELLPLVRSGHPLLHAATLLISHPQNRNQGTVGGSLAHADPAAELPAVALALDAALRAVVLAVSVPSPLRFWPTTSAWSSTTSRWFRRTRCRRHRTLGRAGAASASRSPELFSGRPSA